MRLPPISPAPMPPEHAASPRPLHTLRLPVRWGDMDVLGHVNNAMYLRYFEQSRIDWLGTLGIFLTGEGEGPVLLKATVTWLRPVTYPGDIEVRLFPGRVGGTSFHLGGEIVNARDAAERCSQADFVLVWTDYGTKRPVRVPERLRAILEAR